MRKPFLVFVLTFVFLGLADSWYLAQSALTNTALTCNIAGLTGCNIVAQSVYDRLFGIPLGVYGVVFYAILFTLTAFLLLKNIRLGYVSLLALSTIGLIASAIFVYLQIFVIQALCVYCLASGAISLIVFILALVLWKKYAPLNVVAIPSIPLPPQS